MILSESDFLRFAFSRYDNPQLSSIDEFETDLKRFTYLNNLLNRYRSGDETRNERLILNHIVILSNCFTVAGCVTMLNFRITEENKPILDTFLYFLKYIDKTKYNLDFILLDLLNAS